MKQHTQPCKECPFRRKGMPGWLGGSEPEVFVAQAHGEFWLPCHCHSDYEDPGWKTDIKKPQCAGAAIYRANVAKQVRPASALITLPKNHTLVFSTPAEFIAFHRSITVEEVQRRLLKKSIVDYQFEELRKVMVDGEGGLV